MGGVGAALHQRRYADPYEYRDHLLYGYGYGRAYHHFQLPDVRFFAVWKNLLNIWAILAGVYLYARYHKTSMRRYIYIGLYGTSLSPIITQMMQVGSQPGDADAPVHIHGVWD